MTWPTILLTGHIRAYGANHGVVRRAFTQGASHITMPQSVIYHMTQLTGCIQVCRAAHVTVHGMFDIPGHYPYPCRRSL